MKWQSVFPDAKPIIGMLHVQALPATPSHQFSMSEITDMAVSEAKLYAELGLDGIMLENMHDVPYLNTKVGVEITASMTAIACAIRKEMKIPIGIQILAAANKEALAVALAANLQFIRAEGFVYGHLADEGYIQSCAGELLRYRKQIGAEHIAVLTDIKKKHSSHSITRDISLGKTAAAAEFFLSDGLVITGVSTGTEVLPSDLEEARANSRLPIIIGSGITADNLEKYWKLADGFIVGSYFKEQGLWSNGLSQERVTALIERVYQLRK